jgi:hypothetical protein
MSRTRPQCVGCGSASTPLQCDRVLPTAARVCRRLLCRECAVPVRAARIARFTLHHCPRCVAEEREAALASTVSRVHEVMRER